MLVIEDVLTTGGSTRETMQVARAAGAQVVGAASIVDRSGGSRASSTCRSRRCSTSRCPTYEPERLSAVRAGVAGREAGSRPVVA